MGNLSFSNQENEFMRNGVILSEFDGDSRLDLWVLGLKVMATGITATLSVLFLVFLLSRRRPSWRERGAVWHFTLASLFATLFIGADAAVRASAVLDNVDGVLLPYRLALSALVLSIAAYVGLSWTLDPARPSSFRATAMLYACAALFAIAVWVDHPFLIIAGDAFTIRGTGVYADYGAGAPLLFALCAVLFVLMCRGLLPLAYRIGGTTVWRLTVLGFVVLFAAGVHDALLELNLMPIPVGLLPLGYACFQMGAFAVLAIHYSRTLEDRQVQGLQLRRLTDAVSRDAYTGLFSRTYLEDTLNRLGAGAAGGLLFIDLDHFKAINDTFGHASGDQIIRAVADRIRINMRDDDVACRWGGDEFVIYLPGTDAEALGALSERLQQAFKTVGVEFSRARRSASAWVLPNSSTATGTRRSSARIAPCTTPSRPAALSSCGPKTRRVPGRPETGRSAFRSPQRYRRHESAAPWIAAPIRQRGSACSCVRPSALPEPTRSWRRPRRPC